MNKTPPSTKLISDVDDAKLKKSIKFFRNPGSKTPAYCEIDGKIFINSYGKLQEPEEKAADDSDG